MSLFGEAVVIVLLALCFVILTMNNQVLTVVIIAVNRIVVVILASWPPNHRQVEKFVLLKIDSGLCRRELLKLQKIEQQNQQRNEQARAAEPAEARAARLARDRVAHQVRWEDAHAAVVYAEGRPTVQQLQQFERDPTAALLRLAEGSGFDIVGQAIGDRNERRQQLLDRIRDLPVESVAQRLAGWNQHMDPNLPLNACACCGESVIGQPLVRLVPVNELNVLQLSDNARTTYCSSIFPCGIQ
jgi:hypothetical protein